ncbi:hypothetical protein [Synechococcus phage DSL-LC02]|nr:hypothetical protein [Synechococcus phage DSL-LC02]
MPEDQKYCLSKERFSVISGQKLAPHGEVMHGVITGEGDGTIIYKNGREVTVAKERSLEYVGQNINLSGITTISKEASENGFNPAKYICAEKGDIMLESKQGKIILCGTQVEIYSTGSKLDKTGGVFIRGNTTVQLKAPDIQIKGTKTAITGTHSISVIGKNYLDTISGFHAATTASDSLVPCGGAVTKALSILTTFQNVFNA